MRSIRIRRLWISREHLSGRRNVYARNLSGGLFRAEAVCGGNERRPDGFVSYRDPGDPEGNEDGEQEHAGADMGAVDEVL